MMSTSAAISSSARWDAIVVGAGLGGLSAAAHLSATGQRTLLLERYNILGGSSHVFRRKNQWEFDCGVHYIGDCGPGGQTGTLMRGLGMDRFIEWQQLNPQGFDTVIGPDLELRIPAGWDAYLENLLAAFPREAPAVRRYVSVMRRIGEAHDHSMDFTSTAAMARFAARCGSAAPWMLVPHAVFMAACRLSPRAILTLSLPDGAIAVTPQVAPVAMIAGLLNHFIGGGAWYPRGGGQMLSAGFAEVIRSHGGEIRTQTHVERIVVEHGEVTGVRLEGGEVLSTKAVVAAGDIKRTYRDLVGYENLPRAVARRSERWKMAQPVINACFGIELDVTDTPDSNFFVIPNWDMATSLISLQRATSRLVTHAGGRDPVEWAQDFARHQPAFVQCSTRHDLEGHRGAPRGHAAIEVQTITPSSPRLWGYDGYDTRRGTYRREARYQQIKEIITEGMLARVERVYPGASAKVRWAELGTPASQERFTHTSDGAAMGLEPRISQYGVLRPKTRTAIKGLFLAGTSTAWGPGTAGSMLSGLHAASAITGRDLQAEIRAGKVLVDASRFATWGPDFDPFKATRLLGRRQHTTQEDVEEENGNAAPLAVGGIQGGA